MPVLPARRQAPCLPSGLKRRRPHPRALVAEGPQPALSGRLCGVRRWPESFGKRSERVPSRAAGEFQIADIDAEPGADAGADRHHDDAAVGHRRHAEAADEVGRAVDAAEAAVEVAHGGQVVDEHHGARAVAADIEAERRPLPVDPALPGIAGIERALAEAQAADDGAGRLLSQDVAVGLAPAPGRLLDGEREAAGHAAEEAVPILDHLGGAERVRAHAVVLIGQSGGGPGQEAAGKSGREAEQGGAAGRAPRSDGIVRHVGLPTGSLARPYARPGLPGAQALPSAEAASDRGTQGARSLEIDQVKFGLTGG
ncbi:protein of unknown function [Methylorubrum extorquens]|uniref:Uncharacterized protein n=1 Tax=Methylorubrum extorquens TaxID=408 RepID=A0A2N9ATX0_METEX|nr:protein of unknown function [Methylorubrum extorquens]